MRRSDTLRTDCLMFIIIIFFVVVYEFVYTFGRVVFHFFLFFSLCKFNQYINIAMKSDYLSPMCILSRRVEVVTAEGTFLCQGTLIFFLEL